jgi:hypothetical protein
VGTGDPDGASSGMVQLRILQFDQPRRMFRQLRALGVAQAQAIFFVFPGTNNVNIIHINFSFFVVG